MSLHFDSLLFFALENMSSSSLSNLNESMSTTSTNTITTTHTNPNKEHLEHDHDHEHDLVMPGFRFHPTEEELIEFYLRRKVEGKRFNVELITYLDLYRYDPWELPAMAAIGEKEWYFYVPRDRKYRNGDRPNRVTNSGYWKATGADRMIRSDHSSKSIGLKKTLVFYSGKAPKGIRTSWIMNEYRLPHHETERYNKTEISLCRVYKRAGVEDHPSVISRSLSSRASSSRSSSISQSDKRNSQDLLTTNRFNISSLGQLPQQINIGFEKFGSELMEERSRAVTSGSDVATTALALSNSNQNSNNEAYHPHLVANDPNPNLLSTSLSLPPSIEDIQDHQGLFLNQCKQPSSSNLVPNIFTSNVNFTTPLPPNPVVIDELHRLVNYQNAANYNNQLPQQFYPPPHHLHLHQQQSATQLLSSLVPQSQQLAGLNALPNTLQPSASLLERLWEWNNNQIQPEASNRDDDHNLFK